MNIKEFASKYCQDIIEEAKRCEALFDLANFSYDTIITDEDGTKVPVVTTANYDIPVADILSMDRTEFSRVWGYPECMEAYDAYLSSFIILEGPEALTATRDALRKALDRVDTYDKIPEAFR